MASIDIALIEIHQIAGMFWKNFQNHQNIQKSLILKNAKNNR